MIYIKATKRDEYMQAWKIMWNNNKQAYKDDWRMKHVSPSRFTKTSTEIDEFCVVAYEKIENQEDKPIGVFGMALLKTGRLLGKQIVSDPNYRGIGLGQALILTNESQVKEYTNCQNYIISCLDTTARIYDKFGVTPLSEAKNSHNGIPYGIKYLVPLYRENFDKQYSSILKRFKTTKDEFFIPLKGQTVYKF